MAKVRLTRHLHAFFPALGEESLDVGGRTVAEVIRNLDERAPGLAFYLCDEIGRLRPHVNVFVNGERVRDRRALSDPLTEASEVTILQALSGG